MLVGSLVTFTSALYMMLAARQFPWSGQLGFSFFGQLHDFGCVTWGVTWQFDASFLLCDLMMLATLGIQL